MEVKVGYVMKNPKRSKIVKELLTEVEHLKFPLSIFPVVDDLETAVICENWNDFNKYKKELYTLVIK
jgi:hypothetical protein